MPSQTPRGKKAPPKAKKAKKETSYPVPALDRGLDVLEILAAARRPLLLSEVAAEMGLASGVMFRLLTRLESRQYLARDPATGRFSLSLRLYALALAQNPLDHLLRAARLPMEELAVAAGESCHLSILLGQDILVVASTATPAPIHLTVEVGSRHQAAQTTSGRLLAALRPREEWAKLVPGTPAAALETLLKNGHASASNERLIGVHDLAVPVRLADGHAALAVPHLSSSRTKDDSARRLALLQSASAQISAAMGLPATPPTPAHA